MTAESDAAFGKWREDYHCPYCVQGCLMAAWDAGRAYEERRRWTEAAKQMCQSGNRIPYSGPSPFKVTPVMLAEIEEAFTPSKPVIKDGSEPF